MIRLHKPGIAIHLQSLLVLVLGMQAACAAAPGSAVPVETLTIDNASIDVIRVSLDLGNREMLLGRVEPMTRARLRIPAGAVHIGSPRIRVLVRALGAPVTTPLPSDWYPGLQLLGLDWRYSGSAVVPSGIPSR